MQFRIYQSRAKADVSADPVVMLASGKGNGFRDKIELRGSYFPSRRHGAASRQAAGCTRSWVSTTDAQVLHAEVYKAAGSGNFAR